MGWWRDREGRLLGDGPADVLGEALEKAPGGKPPLGEVLSAVGRALRRAPGRLAQPASDGWRLAAQAGDKTIAEGDAPPAALQRLMDDTLDELADQYRSSELARLPSVDEVVATLDFVLAGEPSRFVSGAAKPLRIFRRDEQ